MTFPIIFASSMTFSVMAQIHHLPLDTTTSVAPSPRSLFEIQHYHLHNDEGYVYKTEGEIINELQLRSDESLDVVISHTETAESMESPPEEYQQHLHTTQPAMASTPIIYAWTVIATAATLMIRFIFTQQYTITSSSPKASSFQSWLHHLSERLDRFDYWHAVSRWLYVSDELSTDDWLGFDSFLEWIEVAVENVGRCGMEFCGC